jgi:hypothetical protein
MKKLATLLYDVTDFITAGNIQYLADITKNNDELVKNAHVPTLDEAEQMSDDEFALVLFHPHLGTMKKLAMSDKYITELNMKIFVDNIKQFPEEIVKVASKNLCKAAHFYGLQIPTELTKYANEPIESNWVNIAAIKEVPSKTFIKTAESVVYALRNKYPIHTPEFVKKAILYLNENRYRFSPFDALEYATNVKIAADKFNVDYTNSVLAEYANLKSTRFNEKFAAAVGARKGYVEDENRQTYDELIEKADELGIIKTAEVLEKLDRATGVYKQWGISILDPIFSVFDSEAAKLVKVGSYSISSKDLQRLPAGIVDDGTLSDLRGDEGLEVFASLPTPVREKIAKVLKQ